MKRLCFQLVLLFIFLTGVQPIWAQSPMVLEALPPQAILKLNNIDQTGKILTPDNRILQLSTDKKSLEIHQFSRVERVSLPEQATGLIKMSNNFVHIALNSKKDLFLHLPTQKTYIFSSNPYSASLQEEIFKYSLAKHNEGYALFDGESGEK